MTYLLTFLVAGIAILFLANIYLSLYEEFKAIIAFCCLFSRFDLIISMADFLLVEALEIVDMEALEILDVDGFYYFADIGVTSSLSEYSSAQSSSF